jgi:hypothetical protein
MRLPPKVAQRGEGGPCLRRNTRNFWGTHLFQSMHDSGQIPEVARVGRTRCDAVFEALGGRVVVCDHRRGHGKRSPRTTGIGETFGQSRKIRIDRKRICREDPRMRSTVIGAIGLGVVAVLLAARRSSSVKGRPRSPKSTAAMHAQARADALDGFRQVVKTEPTDNELRMLMAVSLHETTYGQGWRGPGEGSFNMGAIHATPSWTGLTFQATDTSPTDTGGAVAYSQAFRSYPNAVDGWADLAAQLMLKPKVRAAAESGSPQRMAEAMRAAKYYEGSGATEKERIHGYAQALADSLLEISKFWSQP